MSSNAKERALRHRAKVKSFFSTIGSAIGTGAKKVNENVLAPTGTYVKTMAIGDRNIDAEQEALKRERLERLGLDPKSVLFQRLMKEPDSKISDDAIAGHVIIMARITPIEEPKT